LWPGVSFSLFAFTSLFVLILIVIVIVIVIRFPTASSAEYKHCDETQKRRGAQSATKPVVTSEAKKDGRHQNEKCEGTADILALNHQANVCGNDSIFYTVTMCRLSLDKAHTAFGTVGDQLIVGRKGFGIRQWTLMARNHRPLELTHYFCGCFFG
jgi:hypothetical protein